MSAATRAAMARAVSFIIDCQEPDGEFPSYMRTARHDPATGSFNGTPFFTSFVLYALAHTNADEARPALERGLAFLERERTADGLWRYTTARNPWVLVPDLDDTCCAAFTLRLLAPDRLGAVNQAAILANRAASGMFKTWVCGPDEVNNVDSVVNANVALYLGPGPHTDRAVGLINLIILGDAELASTYYYLDELSLYYMVSRAYFHGVIGFNQCREAMIRKTLARHGADGSFGDDLQTGLALCTLCNLGLAQSPASGRAAQYLLDHQRADGGWEDQVFYAGPEPPEARRYWWSSPAFSTAICLEGIAKAAGQAPRL
ncbi:MAG: prenyltransferase/squalene oxidase repeat-containing protein [Gemmatimonadota bacterium]